MKKFILPTLLLLFAFAPFVKADIALPKPTPTPKPQKQIDSQLSIKIDSETEKPTLIIPKKMMRQLRAEIDDADDATNNMATVSGSNNFPTIFGGALMSLSLIVGGVWFARSRQKLNKTTIGIIVLFTIGIGGATITFANMAPPGTYGITSSMFSPEIQRYKRAYGSIKVKTSNEDNDSIILVVPQDKTKTN